MRDLEYIEEWENEDFELEYDESVDSDFYYEEDDYCCWHPKYQGDLDYCTCKEHQEYIEAEYNKTRNKLVVFIERQYYSIRNYITIKLRTKKASSDFDDLPF